MGFIELFNRPGLIAAHRGNRSVRPENTLAALRASIGHCDFIEIDVQLSKDSIPVIIHDETLTRTTDVISDARFADRYPWNVHDFTLDELLLLDFGSWFYREDPFRMSKVRKMMAPKIRREHLLTLGQALLFAKEQQMPLNIEIKDLSGSLSDREVVNTVTDHIRQSQSEVLILLSSFRHEYLPLCKALLPEVPTAALQEVEHPKALISYLRELNVDAYHPDEQILDRETTVRLREAGFAVSAFTVNDPQRARELFSWDVNAVFTDFPTLMSYNKSI